MASTTPRAWDEHRPPDPDLIADCVHCGFCLPTCPSYAVFEDEMDSPRGRIVLMRVGNEEGSEASPEMRTHFDRCLGCMACVTACPSGVQYDKLILETRPQVERNAPRPRHERLYRQAIFALFTHPARLRALAPMLALQQRLGVREKLAPRLGRVPELRALLQLAPPVKARAAIARLPEVTRAKGAPRGRVAFMQGCVQRVFFGDVNAATVRVLSAEGWEVHAPRQPRCCGSLQLHAGEEEEAQGARQGDDRGLRGLRGDHGQRRRLRLGHEGLRAPPGRRAALGRPRGGLLGQGPRRHRAPGRARAAGSPPPAPACGSPTTTPATSRTRRSVREQPRALLRAIPGLELLEPADWELCCGSAGIYNLVEPEAAAELGARKAANLLATGAEAVAAGNPGCALQIAAHLGGRTLPIFHPDDPARPRHPGDPPMTTARAIDVDPTGDPAHRRSSRPRRSTSWRSCTAASARAGGSSSPPAASAPRSSRTAARWTSWRRRARSARATGRSRRRPRDYRDRRVEITGPDRPQAGHQRAQLRRARLHGRLRGRQLPHLGQPGRRPRQPDRRHRGHDRVHEQRRQGVHAVRPTRPRCSSARAAGTCRRSTCAWTASRAPGRCATSACTRSTPPAGCTSAAWASSSTCPSSSTTSRRGCGTTCSGSRRTSSASRAGPCGRPS